MDLVTVRLPCLASAVQQASAGRPTLLDHIQVARPHTLHHLLAILEHVALLCEEHDTAAPASATAAPAAVPSDPEAAALGAPGLEGQQVGHTGAEQAPPPPGPRPGLLVIDSVSAVVGPVLGMPQHSQGYTALASLGRMLRQLASTHRLAILVTNHTVVPRSGDQQDKEGEGQQRQQRWQQVPQGGAVQTGGGRQLVPAMGESWRTQVHARITLTLTPEGPEGPRRATLSTGAMVGSVGTGMHVQAKAQVEGLVCCMPHCCAGEGSSYDVQDCQHWAATCCSLSTLHLGDQLPGQGSPGH